MLLVALRMYACKGQKQQRQLFRLTRRERSSYVLRLLKGSVQLHVGPAGDVVRAVDGSDTRRQHDAGCGQPHTGMQSCGIRLVIMQYASRFWLHLYALCGITPVDCWITIASHH